MKTIPGHGGRGEKQKVATEGARNTEKNLKEEN
jgi:hypothetical protein